MNQGRNALNTISNKSKSDYELGRKRIVETVNFSQIKELSLT